MIESTAYNKNLFWILFETKSIYIHKTFYIGILASVNNLKIYGERKIFLRFLAVDKVKNNGVNIFIQYKVHSHVLGH